MLISFYPSLSFSLVVESISSFPSTLQQCFVLCLCLREACNILCSLLYTTSAHYIRCDQLVAISGHSHLIHPPHSGRSMLPPFSSSIGGFNCNHTIIMLDFCFVIADQKNRDHFQDICKCLVDLFRISTFIFFLFYSHQTYTHTQNYYI